MIFLEKGWLKQSRQDWKLKTFIGLLFTSGILSIGLVLDIHANDFLWMLNMVAAIALFLFSLIWLNTSIKCPQCNNSIGAFFLKGKNVSLWLIEFQMMEECPVCEEPLLDTDITGIHEEAQ